MQSRDRPTISPMPRVADSVGLPWDVAVVDPIAALAEARGELGDTLVVDSGDDRRLADAAGASCPTRSLWAGGHCRISSSTTTTSPTISPTSSVLSTARRRASTRGIPIVGTGVALADPSALAALELVTVFGHGPSQLSRPAVLVVDDDRRRHPAPHRIGRGAGVDRAPSSGTQTLWQAPFLAPSTSV